ncbi:MAG TPA: hypothetical protein VFO01_11485 [Trebonia sp.]|nr:hypothetical protein [Trebonia sp.]
MTANPRYQRDPRTGKFAPRRPVPDVDAESRFDPVGDDIPFDDVSGASSPNTIEQRRYVPEADELAQGGQRTSVGIRRPVLVHPDDAGHYNGLLRTAARDSGPLDPTAYLAGLGQPATPPAGRESSVQVYGDGGPTMSPTRAEDVAPGNGRGRSHGR